MNRRKSVQGAYSWLQVEGIDYPYPEHVQAALDLVERTTKRLAREAREAACSHLDVEHTVLRNMVGNPVIDEHRCTGCGKSMAVKPLEASYLVPIAIEMHLPKGQLPSGPDPFAQMLVQQASAVLDDTRQLTPVKRGNLSKSVTARHP